MPITLKVKYVYMKETWLQWDLSLPLVCMSALLIDILNEGGNNRRGVLMLNKESLYDSLYAVSSNTMNRLYYRKVQWNVKVKKKKPHNGKKISG